MMKIDDQILINHLNRYEEITPEQVAEFERGLNPVMKSEWESAGLSLKDKQWNIARQWFYQRSLAEALRLGYKAHDTETFTHSAAVLVEIATGDENGHALAKKYGFKPDDPAAMWHVLGHRVEGEAVVALIGDDRGWAGNWQYFIAVAWYPASAAEAGYEPTYVLI
jgi:hypothetical protein